ncbi:MAG TPA: DUF4340 domain-containing protein [Anaerolineales bacterium]|nr:DUF4340 domain-containing protein [Anaerolineales bacterium]
MIRTSTVVYVVLLLGLVGAYFYLRNRPQPADIGLTPEPEAEVAPEYLFTAEDGTPTSIRLEAKSGETVQVARDAENAWAITEPVEAKADQGAAEAAASQITTMRVLDTVPDVDLGIVGLQVPEYVLTIEFTDGGERIVDVGVMTPTESGYYVRDTDGKVIIVSRSAIDALLGLLDNPPYLETPTLEAGATATSTP